MENSETKINSFKDQFARAEKYEVAGGTAEVVDIKPEKPKTEVPVFFAPAWGCTTEVYKPALEILSQTQRRVISLNHPRLGGSMENLVTEIEADKYPTEGLRKALNILGILVQKKIERTDVIAHSEGALNAVIAATLHPQKFRNIILFAPAGLIGEDKFTRLLQGFLAQSKRADTMSHIPITDTEKQVASTAAIEAIKYLAKNPIRGINEARDIAKSQIHELLPYLHRKGIGVVVMSGVDDPVFPMERMQQIAKADMIDGFLSLRGGHGEIGNHPDKFMTAAEGMLTALENKREQRQNPTQKKL